MTHDERGADIRQRLQAARERLEAAMTAHRAATRAYAASKAPAAGERLVEAARALDQAMHDELEIRRERIAWSKRQRALELVEATAASERRSAEKAARRRQVSQGVHERQARQRTLGARMLRLVQAAFPAARMFGEPRQGA